MNKTQIGFLIESLVQAIEPFRKEIIDTYADLYVPDTEKNKWYGDVDKKYDCYSWELYDMVSCIIMDAIDDVGRIELTEGKFDEDCERDLH